MNEIPIHIVKLIEGGIQPEQISELCGNVICKDCPMIGYVALVAAMKAEKNALTSTTARTLAYEALTRSGNMCKTGPINGDCQSIKPVPEFVQPILEAIREGYKGRTMSDEAE